MTSRRLRKPAAARSIFVNCPFDDAFRPIFRSIVFTVVLSGFHPRCALDSTDGAEVRIAKIARMIGECDWGIHDLSRVELSEGGIPRFNMPLELGIHLGARLLGDTQHRRKRALVLDSQPHRYDASLSDISGQDIECHGNDPDRAIEVVRNWLSDHRRGNVVPLPGVAAMQADYALFQAEVVDIIAQLRLDPLDRMSHSDFLHTIHAWVSQRSAQWIDNLTN